MVCGATSGSWLHRDAAQAASRLISLIQSSAFLARTLFSQMPGTVLSA